MNNQDAFERILASLYDAMLDETRRRQRPNYLGLRHWILSRGVDFKWLRV